MSLVAGSEVDFTFYFNTTIKRPERYFCIACHPEESNVDFYVFSDPFKSEVTSLYAAIDPAVTGTDLPWIESWCADLKTTPTTDSATTTVDMRNYFTLPAGGSFTSCEVWIYTNDTSSAWDDTMTLTPVGDGYNFDLVTKTTTIKARKY